MNSFAQKSACNVCFEKNVTTIAIPQVFFLWIPRPADGGGASRIRFTHAHKHFQAPCFSHTAIEILLPSALENYETALFSLCESTFYFFILERRKMRCSRLLSP